MDLKKFITPLSKAERELFASQCETTKGHLQNVMYGIKPCATNLAVLIERESGGKVRRWELRSDWFRHWPELIGKEGAPEVPQAYAPSAQAATETVASEV
ncbi:MAG: YdaS family helix-turn-helix protein [Rhodoferax sp.]|uniref:YdaS family helix-turn-helix protein n=1 Tax=Rhodoferax sp. TaxID=50421 RepID=UPI002ACEF496|nr:YdaS family helix-turn-helix protein [Rhodoferax sp.]MDZ7892358.1 YdaS family helix-turn-helix protein [Rhodoferax sp.]